MSYIGRQPQIGNFQICDAISTVNNQAAYTMQVSSVDVLPESANHMIVSLNGVIQKPNSSYTVSGATITFASNLVTGDVINFIQILGSVLDLGVPSDDTVTAAKLSSNAVTTAKILDANVTTAKIADANVTLAKLSATGTKNSTTFLRGDNTFATAGLTGVTTDSGNVTITDGNLTFGGAGHGVHLGVTSATAANLLDDYEEGTWTPVINNSGVAQLAMTNNGAHYTKIGRMVYLTATLRYTGSTISSGATIIGAGLPFTAAASSPLGCSGSYLHDPGSGNSNYIAGICGAQANSTNYYFIITPGGRFLDKMYNNYYFQFAFNYRV